MQKIIFIYLLLASFCNCQLNGKFWWTDSRVAKFQQVKIPEPVIEDISPFETDESVKIVFRDKSPYEFNANLKPIYSNKKLFINASPDICHYVKANECRGIIYSTKYGKSINKSPRDPRLVCCLEIPRKLFKEDPKIYFPGFRRDNNNYISHISKRSVQIGMERQTKVLNTQTDYDEDPYWNIKNSNFYNSQISEHHDVADDSVDELPKPGLIGIYSDCGKRPDWSVQDQDYTSEYDSDIKYEEVDDTPSFGYSSIDPRRETKTPLRRLTPMKLKTPSEEIPYDPRTQIISYKSDPDFKVLEGFKLLNLVKSNKNSFEEINDNNRNKHVLFDKPLASSSSNSEEYFSAENDKIFSDCGKYVPIEEKDQQRGEATVGSHPWLAAVVHTRERNNFLCYATLIHPRAALTVANCVDKSNTTDELTLIAGMQYPSRRSRISSRISKVILHPDYSQIGLANNLALLILQNPPKLSTRIQPACLADPGSGQDCMFFGWGGFESGVRPRSWWQRGKIRPCNRRASEELPPNSFCVSVQPRHSIVTGIGGPLICNVNGRAAVVGILVIYRHAPVLIPVRGWAMQSTDLINAEI